MFRFSLMPCRMKSFQHSRTSTCRTDNFLLISCSLPTRTISVPCPTSSCGVKRNVFWLLASFDIDSLTSSLNRSHFHVRLYNSDLFNASKPTSNSVIVGCMAGFIYFLIIIQSCASGLDIFAYDRSLSLSSLPSSLDVVIAGLLTFYFLKKKDGNL